MKKNTLFAGMLALLPGLAQAGPVAESLTYRGYIGGLPLGDLTLNTAMDDSRYKTQVGFEMAALLRRVLDADVTASASGARAGDALAPYTFEYSVEKSDGTRNVRVDFSDGGRATEVSATPALDKRAYDLTLDQVTDAVDPVTAAAILSAPRSGPCDLDVRVFDSRKLHRIILSEGRPSTQTIRCDGRYERIAGFKAKHMSPERRTYAFEAELEQIGPNRWRPTRISAQTKFGVAIVVLKEAR